MSTTNSEVLSIEQAISLKGKRAIAFFTDEESVRPLIEHVKNEALSLVPNVQTKKGRDEIGSTALKVSKSRKAITDAIDQSVADLKRQVLSATNIKRYVTNELNETREKVLAPRNAWQAEQERLEQERINEIKSRISNISALGTYSNNESKVDIANRIDALQSMNVSDGFAELASEAAATITQAIGKLNNRVLQIVEEDKAREQQKLLQEERKRNQIQERISSLIQIPLSFMGKGSTEIKLKLSELKLFDIHESEYENRTVEAKAALDQVIIQLTIMYDQVTILEAQKEKEHEVSITEDKPTHQPRSPAIQAALERGKAAIKTTDISTVDSSEVTSPSMISLPENEVKYLRKRDNTLSALEAAGVDNWAGYDDAIAELYSDENVV